VKIVVKGEIKMPDNLNSKTGKILAATLFLVFINMTVFVILTKCKKKKTG